MKKLFVSVLKLAIIVAAGIGLLCIGMMQEWRTETIIATALFGGILIALLLGAFDIEEPIHRVNLRDGARSMHRAA